MKVLTQHFTKPALASIMACLLVSAIFLSGCDAQQEEVQPQEMRADAKVDQARQGMTHQTNQELASLRAAVARFHKIEHAIAAGYTTEITGYVSQMGYHYLYPRLLDDRVELERPEILVYAPAPNGGLRLVAVEYAVPIADMSNPQPAPKGFTGDADVWAINTQFSVWTLHVWIGLDNPHGIFAAHNPRIP